MKKHGMLNSHISKVLTDLGHTDTIVIGDAGLPVPVGFPKIDLSVSLGLPSFQDVLKAVTDDMIVEKVTLANEIQTNNPETHLFLKIHFKNQSLDYISHEMFKEQIKKAKVMIRTGEATPYSNCILHAGVIF
ncbi:D-ribose pyranase [Bacillus pakistanensis]|uniref:D-ribose pyranase n=1 Tax=Rossellomorea pakistanensis TaxID=992288 RepID=A0ABS2N799_9BACI|nr:D-ribose pyranase [Bacillus pakistanensis]MBM7583731.1 D-ribose pyranase [Bacillus pakistanensis]